jgi:hypothetical protein
VRVPTMVQEITQRLRYDGGVCQVDVGKICRDDTGADGKAAVRPARLRAQRNVSERDPDQRMCDVVQLTQFDGHHRSTVPEIRARTDDRGRCPGQARQQRSLRRNFEPLR